MEACFKCINAILLPIQVTMIMMLAVNPRELVAQGGAPKPPEEVLREFRKMDSEGGRLTADGWYRAARFFVKPAPLPRYRVVEVIMGETIEAHAQVSENRTTIRSSLDMLGQIDSEGRFTSLVAPSLLDPSGQPRKKPWGQERHGPAHFKAPQDLILTDTHWEYTSDYKNLREVRGTPEWRLEGAGQVPMVTVQAAIQYLTQMHDESANKVIKRNAQKSIVDLQLFVKRLRSKSKP